MKDCEVSRGRLPSVATGGGTAPPHPRRGNQKKRATLAFAIANAARYPSRSIKANGWRSSRWRRPGS